MDNPFKYCRIGRAFLGELSELVSCGQSAVLLGLRNTGKRYLLKKLAERLGQAAIVIRVDFSLQPSLGSSGEVRAMMDEAVQHVVPEFTLKPIEDSDLLDSVRQLCTRQPRSVVLLASNVDCMAHHLAQLFLREIRVLVETYGLTAVLTGEQNLAQLVYGPDSEFTCAYQFVMQGFDEAEFLDYMQDRQEVALVPSAVRVSFLRELFLQTGGNILLARAVLWAWQDNRSRVQTTENIPSGTDDLSSFIKRMPASYEFGEEVFSHATDIMAGSPNEWHDLDKLLQGGTVDVSLAAQPRSLELAGFATRHDGRLQFASPIMKRFAEGYFDACRFGDLYAVEGDWDTAFRFYERMPSERRLRPSGVGDRTQFSLVIKALAAKIYAEATQGSESGYEKLDVVKHFFARGCRMLLGDPEVTFWTYCGEWKLMTGQTLAQAEADLAHRILQDANRGKIGYQEVRRPVDKSGVFALLPHIRPDFQAAVVLSYVNRPVPISRERKEYLSELLDHFANAYHHTIENVRVQLRLDARRRHLEVATGIVSALGVEVHTPKEALRLAGQELLKLGYRRIMFALVDPAGERICGIADCVGETLPTDVARETNYSIIEAGAADADIQPWVVLNKQACVVTDWQTWNRRGKAPRINDQLCKRAKHRESFAVVPMFIRNWGEAIRDDAEVFGTIHVEREDGYPPSQEDIEDLIEFGRQMAAAAHECERVHSLLQTLNCNRDSIVILDHGGTVRFANAEAQKHLRVPEGWHDAKEKIKLSRSQHGMKISDKDILEVIDKCQRSVFYDTSIVESRLQCRTVVFDPLPDWRTAESSGDPGDTKQKSASGAVLHVGDLSPLHRVFTALREIANVAMDSKSTTVALLTCVKDLDFRAVRLYRIDPHDPDVLVSEDSLGLPSEFAHKFSDGAYRLRRNASDDFDENWWSLDNAEPRVYVWDRAKENGEFARSEYGLLVQNVGAPLSCKDWKREGDFWLDLPLVAPSRAAIGKLTIDCGKEYRCELTPEKFELLKLFSALLGALLATLDKEDWLREAADKAMATCAHNIRTKLAALDGFANRYRRAAPGNADVLELNELHQPAVDGSFLQVTRIKETFAGIRLERAPTQVKPLLEATLEGMFGKQPDSAKVGWELQCPDELDFCLDADRIRNSLEEMMANSLAMVSPGTRLELTVMAKVEKRGAKQWLRLALHDNGPGVPEDKRDRIFESFYSDRPSGKRSTGLGLNFVRRVVEAHNGHVWVNGDSGHGAEFVIEIPS